jgi:hypothetical protein
MPKYTFDINRTDKSQKEIIGELEWRKRKMKKRFLGIVLVMLLCLMLSPAPARAVYIIDFSTGLAGEGGSLTRSGGDVIGSAIPIGAMIVSGTGGSDGVYAVTDAQLNFNTGTKSLTIVGSVPALGLANRPLLTATSMSSFNLIYAPDPSGGFTIYAIGLDTKDRSLLSALGIPLTTEWGYFGWSMTGQPLTAPHSWSALSTDIKNTQVPEPAAMFLLGSGLVGLWGFRKGVRK